MHFKCTVISKIKKGHFLRLNLSLLPNPKVINHYLLSLSITPLKRVFTEVLNGAVLGGE
jgi:hypothetical protein